jgi:hypothetical protein
MKPAHVEVERTLAVPRTVVTETLLMPALYPSWVEGLRSFEHKVDDEYVAVFGYLGYVKTACVRLTADADGVSWTRLGGNTALDVRIEAVEAEWSGATHVSLSWAVSGSGFLFGEYSSNPLFRATLHVMADRSLGRLEGVSSSAARREA